MVKKRALDSDAAREVRQKGHDDALEFAKELGLKVDYNNDLKAKKDVIDPSGDAHSVKSGVKKWQVFLYGKNRFDSDEGFQVMNGLGDLLMKNWIKEIVKLSFFSYLQTQRQAGFMIILRIVQRLGFFEGGSSLLILKP